jgi:glycosyltransferase involved in cell wall biosynthesis
MLKLQNVRKNKMKVISIVTSFPRNDKDILIPWIIRLIKELQSENIETIVFTSSYCGIGNEIRAGIKVTRFRYFLKRWEKLSHDMSVPEKLKSNKLYFLVLPFFMFFGTVEALNYARKNHFDVIHVHFPFPLAIFGIAMKIVSKKPIIVTCHGSEVNMAKKNRIFRAVFKWMMKYADSITVNSLFMKKELVKIIGNREIEIIPMGSGIGDVENKEFEKEKHEDRKKVLFVGRLIEWKGIKYLIEAFKMLDQEKYELNIVGDGPERKRLEALAADHSSQINFHGYLKGEELEAVYRVADIFVLPSIVDDDGYTEGLGTVLLEAISYNIPVIGSNVGGIPDIIIDRKTGLLIPQKDSSAIAAGIELISGDEKLRKEIIKNAMVHIDDAFSWEMITSRFLNIYKRIEK